MKRNNPLPHLNVAILPLLGYFEIQTNHTTGEITVLGGLEEAFCDMIAQYLGFSFTFKVPGDLEWGNPNTDGSWTGLAGMLQREEADLAISRVSIVEERTSVIHFSYPYYFESVKFAKQFPEKLSTTTAFVRPFAKNVWLSLLLYLLLVPLVFRCVLDSTHSLTSLSLRIFGTLLNQSTGMRVCLFRERILVLPFYIATCFITICYVSNLLSFLTLSPLKDGIRDIEQLSRAVKTGSVQCTTFKGTFMVNQLANSTSETVRSIGERLEHENLIEPSGESVVDYIKKQKGVLLASEEDLKLLVDEVFISEDRFFNMLAAVAVGKDFPWKRKLDSIIHRIWSSGLYAKSIEEYLRKARGTPPKNVVGAKRLTMGDLRGIFLLLFCGFFVSIVVFVVEMFLRCFQLKKRIGK